MSHAQLFKIAVSAFIVKDDKILILKRADNEAFLPSVWEVPGGGVDEGETIEQGVIRETKEEAGLDVVPQRLFGHFEYRDGYNQQTVNLNFLRKMSNPFQEADTSSGEMERAAWVTLGEFANYEFTSQTMLEACKEAIRLAE